MTESLEEKAPLILAIETATRAGSVALVRGHEILASASGDASSSHSINLIEIVEGTLKKGKADLSEVALFAAAVGPGSFTGLRIGLATVKSLAVCTGRSCVGVSTLAAIAHAAGTSERTVSLLPAGRGEFFAQLFSVADGRVRELDGPEHLSPNAILEKYGQAGPLQWAGPGAHLQAEALQAWAVARNIRFGGSGTDRSAWTVAPPTAELAISVATLALNEYQSGNTVRPDKLQAVYVRASDVEINEKWRLEK